MFKQHLLKLFTRLFLLIVGILAFAKNPDIMEFDDGFHFFSNNLFLIVLWSILMIEMIHRTLPLSTNPLGSQKHRLYNYRPRKMPFNHYLQKEHKLQNKHAMLVFVLWIGAHGFLGFFYYTGLISRSILLLIALSYGVFDVLCILFYCPFQKWFMKNRCCTTCRIYNWDFFFMFSPLMIIPSFFSWSLSVFAILILLQWEYAYHRHPRRLYPETNQSLQCTHCKDPLCSLYRSQTSTFSSLLKDEYKD